MDNIGQVRIRVNQKEVSLNPFVTNLVGNIVWGIVSSLKIEEEAQEVVIEVSR
ncbi:MAG: hypothetical protein ACE5JC_05440 [Candidatus Zixiibacteriota bacterium]